MHDASEVEGQGVTGPIGVGGMAQGVVGDNTQLPFDFVTPSVDVKPQEEQKKKKRSKRLTSDQKQSNSKKRAYEARKKARQQKASLGANTSSSKWQSPSGG